MTTMITKKPHRKKKNTKLHRKGLCQQSDLKYITMSKHIQPFDHQ